MADDPKDELRARFEDHRTSSESDSESETDQTDETDGASDTDNMGDSSNTHNTGSTDNTSGTSSTQPGPKRDPDSTRNRKQVAFYLSEEARELLSERYDEYDALSKLAGEGGIEKHKDFLESVVRAGLESDQLDDLVGIDRDEIDR